ncbi:MAG TPA: DNA polymerase III subunit gamma/tau [Spirochaetales bacterium]|nr:DNA polymerase III subunit gamma/tau [Spirochaetales bacterium]HQK33212.1 DNA polymerase III subunit gamma/tau [Spirochaetales bacterium]
MAYEVTANRKRPQNFDELAGQDFVSITLKASIESGRIAHAYLFSGPRGCGKTSTARILAKSLNCERGPTAEPCGVCNSCHAITKGASLDVIEIDGASNTSVDNVRQIKDEVLFPPNFSKYKIYIIDEVHMLSNSAFNALLKTIEEPPPYIVFIFATTELHKVPATIRSRCQQFVFRLIPLAVIKERLASAAQDLGIVADDDALMWIAREATGSLRDAYTMFDQVASFSEGHIRLSVIQDKLGIVGSERIGMLISTVAQGDKAKTIELVESIVSSGVSIEQLLVDTIQYVRTLLFIKAGVEKQELLGFSKESVPEQVSALETRHLERMLAVLLDIYRNMRYSVNPRYEIELALVMLCEIRALISRSEIFEILTNLKHALSEGNTQNASGIAEKLISLSSQASSVDKSNKPDGKPGTSAVSSATKPGTVELASEANMVGSSRGASAVDSKPGTSTVSTASATKPGIGDGKPGTSAVKPGIGAVSIAVSRGKSVDSSGYISEQSDSATDTAIAEKERVITALGKQNLMLNAILSRTEDWSIKGDRLEVSCVSNFEADKINAESSVINPILQKVFNRVIQIHAYVVQNSTEHSQESHEIEDSGTTESPAQIVEKVFRGTRLTEE